MTRPPWLDREEYPFASHTFSTPAGRMHYVDEGAGAPILFVHGNPTWSFLYRELIKALAPAYRCVAPDHLGFGLSDRAPTGAYRPAAHAARLRALIEALDLRDLVLVVHDWGGPIGLDYAGAHPERVRGLVILNTWMWPVNDDPYYRLLGALAGSRLGRFLYLRLELFTRIAMPLWFGDRSRLTPEIHDHYLAPLDAPRDRLATWVLSREVLASRAWLAALWRRRKALAPIPKLIVWGMKDLAFREKELRRWQRTFPAADVVRLEGVGHFVPEEAPRTLTGTVKRFLQYLPGGERDQGSGIGEQGSGVVTVGRVS
jgi:haloalkane dehalogenase